MSGKENISRFKTIEKISRSVPKYRKISTVYVRMISTKILHLEKYKKLIGIKSRYEN